MMPRRILRIKRRYLEAVRAGRKSIEIRGYPLKPGKYLLQAGPYQLEVYIGEPSKISREDLKAYLEAACCTLEELDSLIGPRSYYFIHPIFISSRVMQHGA